MQFTRHIPTKGDRALEALVIACFFGIIVLLALRQVPSQNREMIAGGLGAASTLVMLVAKSLWERNGATAAIAENTREAIAKIPPAGSAVDQPADTSAGIPADPEPLIPAASNEGPEIKQAEPLDLSGHITATGVPAGFVGAGTLATMSTIHAPIRPNSATPRETEIME